MASGGEEISKLWHAMLGESKMITGWLVSPSISSSQCMEVDNAVFIEEDVSPDPLHIGVSCLRMVHFRMLVVR